MSTNNIGNSTTHYDYDLIVIGGGSGGMACAKESAKYNKKVCLFDFVKPSTNGTVWGLGGTCVNVGCIPKKLMHYAGLIGGVINHDACKYGWEEERHGDEEMKNKHGEERIRVKHNWTKLVETVQNYIRMLNFSYKNSLRSNKVVYINALAKLRDAHTIEYTADTKDPQNVKTITADKIVISVGGRPAIPADVYGAKECAITSDDIFSLKQKPGKNILVVGGSYIALECAGFLNELGYDVTVAVRSILLRGFDRQCSEKVGRLMMEYGVNFLNGGAPKSMNKLPEGTIHVEFANGETRVFDMVLYAVGRNADTQQLGLENAGVNVEKNGKIKCTNEQTNVSNIYAVGDCLDGKPELTPVAIKAGEMLARRLFANSNEQMDYEYVPTTVFTPVEYACCGYSEEDAAEKYGVENTEVFLSEFTKLEMAASHREKCIAMREHDYDVDLSPLCLSKLVCLKNNDSINVEKEENNGINVEDNKTGNYRVIGFHFVGPNAGEIAQGMAIALRLGATKSDFDKCVGIHPTDAESFVGLNVTKSSNLSWVAAGGCGGGRCG